jgi:hypothetical protein
MPAFAMRAAAVGCCVNFRSPKLKTGQILPAKARLPLSGCLQQRCYVLDGGGTLVLLL